MVSSVRARILVWLLIVLLPVVAASVVATRLVDRDLSERVNTDLDNVRRLEGARINQVLETYSTEAASFAAGPHVVAFTTQLEAQRTGSLGADDVIAGYDGFDVVDPAAEFPLQQLAEGLQAKSRTSAARAVEFRIFGTDLRTLGVTSGFTWDPYDASLVASVLAAGESRYGNAFRNDDDADRVGYVTPVINGAGTVVGAIAMEMELGPITDFVIAHEGFGDTSEAHIAQPTPDGDAEFITQLRFDRDAAFSRVVPASMDLPINRSLDAIGGTTLTSPDYRGVDSILSVETIPATGWGLVVKIDRDEALAPLDRVRWVITAAGAAAAAAVLLGWALFLRPLGARLRRTSQEARNVADGEHAPIGDTSRDEIGEMSRTIDQLAEDLAADRLVRADYERELLRRATEDDLTGLVNRQHATALVGELLSDASNTVSSLMFLDLDGFKTINDTYGHLIGDEVLVSVARRLRGVAPVDSIVSRWGGDEFVIVLPGVDELGVEAFALQARSAFEQPIATSVGPQIVRWSVGTSTTAPGLTLDQMLLDADRRMFEEKQARKGRVAVSSATLREIEDALVEQRIDVHFQPIVERFDSDSYRLWGAEALVRLRRRDGAIALPTEFLEAAQDNHLGAAIDARVAEVAIEQVGNWRRAGVVDDTFTVSLNLCEASTRDPELVVRLERLLGHHGVPASRIILEISEETRVLDHEILDELRSIGCRLAIDDIGVARSSVSRLVDVSPEFGKVDGRWSSESVDGRDLGDPIVARLVSFCRALGMAVVAEGVETVDQHDRLFNLGLTLMQGYLFGPPMAALDFEARLLTTGAFDIDRSVSAI